MKTRSTLLICLAFLLIFISGGTAAACVCPEPGNTVAAEFVASRNVARMRFLSFDRNEPVQGKPGPIMRVRMTVEKVYKGTLEVGEEIAFAHQGDGECSWGFFEEEVGSSYVFYLGARPAGGREWLARVCSRSASAREAAADLVHLDKLREVRGRTRIYGTVSLIKDNRAYGSPDRRVRISGMGRDVTVTTDKNGVFEVYGLPPGRYRITPEKVDGGWLLGNAGGGKLTPGASASVRITPRGDAQKDFFAPLKLR
jgi:hypothetical protein